MSCFHFPDNFQSVNCLTFIQIPPSTGLKVKVLYRLSMLPSICRLLILLSIGIISWKTGSKFLEYTFFTASWFKHISKTIWSLNVAVPRKISLLGQFLGNYQDRSVSLQRPILKIWDPSQSINRICPSSPSNHRGGSSCLPVWQACLLGGHLHLWRLVKRAERKSLYFVLPWVLRFVIYSSFSSAD